MPTRQLVPALLLAIATIACGASTPPTSSGSSIPGPPSFDEWADGFAEEWMRASPQASMRAQSFSGDEQDALDRQLTLVGEWDVPFGAKAAADRAARARRGREALDRIPADSLTPLQRTSTTG